MNEPSPAHGNLALLPDIVLAERLFAELQDRTSDTRGVTRMSYGPGEEIAHAIFRREAEALGLAVESDAGPDDFQQPPERPSPRGSAPDKAASLVPGPCESPCSGLSIRTVHSGPGTSVRTPKYANRTDIAPSFRTRASSGHRR